MDAERRRARFEALNSEEAPDRRRLLALASDEDRRWATRLAALYVDEIDWAYVRSRLEPDPGERATLQEIEGVLEAL